jgi:hypothetical protein
VREISYLVAFAAMTPKSTAAGLLLPCMHSVLAMSELYAPVPSHADVYIRWRSPSVVVHGSLH